MQNVITELPGLTFHQEIVKYTLILLEIVMLYFILYTFYKIYKESKKECNFEIRRKI